MPIVNSVDFGNLVGAQLNALIDAEIEAAERSSEYIESVGFQKNESDDSLKLRMVTFEMARRDADGEVRAHKIQVPILTLVPIPLISIEEANLEFDLRIENIEISDARRRPLLLNGPASLQPSVEEPVPPLGQPTAPTIAQPTAPAAAQPTIAVPAAAISVRIPRLPPTQNANKPKRARLLTRFARTSSTNSNGKANADLRMKIKVTQSAFPIGIERLINAADLSVEDNTADE